MYHAMDSNRHTVAHFVDGRTHGGCEEIVLSLLRGLDPLRWKPVLYHYEAPGLAPMLRQAADAGIECVSIRRPANGQMLLAIWRLARLLRRARPSILHVHLSWPLACRHAILAARLAGRTKVVATSHLPFPLDKVRFKALKWWVQDAGIERFMAVSVAVGSQLLDSLGVDKRKVSVVHNGIVLGPFSGSSDQGLRRSIAKGRNLPIILTPARLHTQKGHDYLLDAAVAVPGAIFVLAGDGPERERLEHKRDALGLRDRVIFLGHRGDVTALLKVCDVFVLPSLYEGLPVSVLEAMASGKPVVATRVGGTDEAITHLETGLLVPAGDAIKLAEAINALLSDPALARRLATAGLDRARTRFSAEEMLRRVEAVYRSVLALPSERLDGLRTCAKG